VDESKVESCGCPRGVLNCYRRSHVSGSFSSPRSNFQFEPRTLDSVCGQRIVVAMNEAKLSIDFNGDWAQILSKRLTAAGYSINPGESPDSVCAKYFNVLKRRISQLPRSVVVSAEFTCPSQHAAGVALISQKAKNGEDLTPHQSRGLLDLNFNDSLLNDWDIHHFHLGTASDQSGFIQRTGPLLFARVSDTYFYFIDVAHHGDWTRQRLVEIVHNNWPDSLSDHRIPGALGLEYRPSDDDIRDLRRADVDIAIQVSDGMVYHSIGGGYNTSGLSVDVRITCNSYWHFFRECEDYVKQHIQELIETARQHGVEIGVPFCFQLGLDGENVYAIETNSRFAFLIGNARDRSPQAASFS
jgi:hypothetical protein